MAHTDTLPYGAARASILLLACSSPPRLVWEMRLPAVNNSRFDAYMALRSGEAVDCSGEDHEQFMAEIEAAEAKLPKVVPGGRISCRAVDCTNAETATWLGEISADEEALGIDAAPTMITVEICCTYRKRAT